MCLYLGDDRALLCDSIWGMTRPWKVSWFWNVAKPWDVWYQVLTFSELRQVLAIDQGQPPVLSACHRAQNVLGNKSSNVRGGPCLS